MDTDNTHYEEDKRHIEQLIKQLNLEEAKIKLETMIQFYKNRADLYDLYSEVLISLNYEKEARLALEQSISLDPLSSGDKYMTYGQLMNKPKKKAEQYFKGIEVYRNIIHNSNANDESLLFAFSSALCSLAELYMTTELCDTKDAEEICENSLQEAYQICSKNPDVLIQLSNLRIIRAKDKEAKEFMDRAFDIIMNTQNTDLFPDSEIIFNLSKNYSELGDYYTANKLLEILVQLDDENVEYWYHLSFNHYTIKNFLYSQNCLDNISELMKKPGFVDEEISEAVKELQDKLIEINKKEGKLINNLLESEEQEDEEERNNSMHIDT